MKNFIKHKTFISVFMSSSLIMLLPVHELWVEVVNDCVSVKTKSVWGWEKRSINKTSIRVLDMVNKHLYSHNTDSLFLVIVGIV